MAIKEIKNLISEDNLSKYGRDFQLKLILLLIKDRLFSLSIVPIIKEEYFSDIYLKNIFTCIKEYIEQYKSLPTIDNIKILLQNKEEKLVAYNTILYNIEQISLDDRDFVIDNARKFCFSKHALTELEKIKFHLDQGEFEKANKISTEAFKYSGLDSRKMYDLKDDYEKIFNETEHRNPVEFPLPALNKNTKGGAGSGNLVITVAPSNFGKTAWLTACARHANKTGKNAAYFSYEIDGVDIIKRYIAGALEVKQEELKYQKEKVRTMIVDSTLGNFRLIQERATKATVDGLKNDIEYLKSTGFFPDVIYVDSLNQLKLKGWRARDDNEKFEYLCEELRDLSVELDIPIEVVYQTNRAGFESELNDEQTIGKAIEPFQVADIVITFSQPNRLFIEGKCIAYLLKNRLGAKKIPIECSYDPNMGTFIQLREVPELLTLGKEEKKKVQASVSNIREKLELGHFNKK